MCDARKTQRPSSSSQHLHLPSHIYSRIFRAKCVQSSRPVRASATPTAPGPLTKPPGQPQPRTNRRELLLRSLLAGCTLGTAGALVGPTLPSGFPLLSAPGPALAASLVDEDVATEVFRVVSPSVAAISVVRTVGGGPVREAVGSGVIWDAAGPHVLTNFHVIPPLQGTSTLLLVTLTDAASGSSTTMGARVVGSDSLHDLAVLRLVQLADRPPLSPQTELGQPSPPQQQQPEGGEEQQQLKQQQQQPRRPQLELVGSSSHPVGAGGEGADTSGAGVVSRRSTEGASVTVNPIRLGTSGDLRVGQSLYALGCLASSPSDPRVATHTLSAGLVSGLDRSIPSPVGARIYGVLQTDAVINAANSGGPLVDSFGRMVGLSTATGSGRSGAVRGSGVNFALPADMLRELVPKIIVYGNAYGKK